MKKDNDKHLGRVLGQYGLIPYLGVFVDLLHAGHNTFNEMLDEVRARGLRALRRRLALPPLTPPPPSFFSFFFTHR